jgi:hypothetical protein
MQDHFDIAGHDALEAHVAACSLFVTKTKAKTKTTKTV